MIVLTRLNGTQLWINPLLIEAVESHPDTVVTLSNGHKYIVREDPAAIAASVTAFLRRVGLVGGVSAPEGEKL
ncbi:flagellar protein FlbD [Alicyclobacillus cellulosilyticus]|uniref:Flagellar protein FlbD n=1 Tax=Alicyclobacillus cellulosilyticus TaxID=1003997 RepID=A0A917K278_9BACL|nr:flagellar FlbD family protein [Alicyclobacillus cellulosilyticus]GGI94701.1 flagellar protein FlbD [Alicyclobacillus cellulosilyticus]